MSTERRGAAPTLTALVGEGLLDAEAAALFWLLRERGVGMVVAGSADAAAPQLANALEDLAVAAGGSGAGTSLAPVLLPEAHALEAVLSQLAAPPYELTADGMGALGLVLIARAIDGVGARLFAAHHLRPVERDAGGHLRHRPPALLVAWDRGTDRLEHFWWAITGDLAERVGLGLGAFEDAHRERCSLLTELVRRGLVAREPLLSAVAPHRPS